MNEKMFCLYSNFRDLYLRLAFMSRKMHNICDMNKEDAT